MIIIKRDKTKEEKTTTEDNIIVWQSHATYEDNENMGEGQRDKTNNIYTLYKAYRRSKTHRYSRNNE